MNKPNLATRIQRAKRRMPVETADFTVGQAHAYAGGVRVSSAAGARATLPDDGRLVGLPITVINQGAGGVTVTDGVFSVVVPTRHRVTVELSAVQGGGFAWSQSAEAPIDIA